MDEISVQMSLSSEAAFEAAVAAVRAMGHRAIRGRSRVAFSIVLVVRHVATEEEKAGIESIIRHVDPAARPVNPPGTFVT